MNRLTQLGVFTIILGGVILFLGLFPFAIDIESAQGLGLVQILAMLVGLALVILGAYVIIHSLLHRGRPRTLMGDIGVRMGLTGLVFSSAATLADLLGFGTHVVEGTSTLGWLQATGLLIGFLFSAVGVLIYGMARS